MEGLQSRDRDIRSQAASAIGRFGPHAKAALPLLRTLAEAAGQDIPNPFKKALLAIEHGPDSPADATR